ncbi:MAG: hypothetical protein ACKVOM_01215 [Ferruginibacter sp.]
MIKIEFNDEKEVEVLIEMYLNKVKNKKDQLSDLETEIQELNAKVLQLRRALQGGEGTYGKVGSDELYSSKWQWVKKICFALEFTKKALTANEIFDVLSKFEMEFNLEKRKIMSSISGTLSSKSGSYEDRKDFIKKEGETGEYEYQIWKEDYSLKKNIFYSGNEITIEDLPF